MNYRTDPKTGNKLSILGFGCMRFPRVRGSIDMAKSEKLVLNAVEKGVNYFDTAHIYPGSEEATGQIIAKNRLRSKVFLATKLPIFYCRQYSDFDKFFNKSLDRLKTDYIDYYLMHMIMTPQQWRQLCDMGIEIWIDGKVNGGQIRQLGFSFHGKADDFKAIVDMRDWDFTMIQYNYLDANSQAGVSGLKYAAGKKMPVFAMEPLLGGRLADPKMLPAKVREIMKEADGEMSPADWSLKWLWNQEELTLALSGMSSQADLDSNVAAAQKYGISGGMSDEETKTVAQIVAQFCGLQKISCTACAYCMPCPAGVNIPGCFTCFNLSYTIKKFYAMSRYLQETGALASAKGLASACVGCKKCEEHCPQSIRIVAGLKTVKKRLEPFWFSWILTVARMFATMKKKAKK